MELCVRLSLFILFLLLLSLILNCHPFILVEIWNVHNSIKINLSNELLFSNNQITLLQQSKLNMGWQMHGKYHKKFVTLFVTGLLGKNLREGAMYKIRNARGGCKRRSSPNHDFSLTHRTFKNSPKRKIFSLIRMGFLRFALCD